MRKTDRIMVISTFTIFYIGTIILNLSLRFDFLNILILNFDEFILSGLVLFFSFFMTLFLTNKWIKSARIAKLFGKDMNKNDHPLIPRSGGLIVTVVICFSLLIYIFLKTFSFIGTPSTNIIEAYAISTTILLAGFIGFVDDVLGWKEGLTQLQKVILTIPIALPLTVINIDQTIILIPFLGNIDLNLFYPLLFVPLGIIGATNGFNLLAGYNGLETSMGLIMFSVFGITGLIVGRLWIALIAFIVITSLLGFLVFNWYPAKVFPGNSFSYSIGSLIAAIAILGNMERIAVWLFIPYFLEIALYIKARVIDKMGDVQAFAKPLEDGSLEMPYNKIYDTTHFAIWFLKKIKERVYERDIVLFIVTIQTLLAISGMILLL